MTRQRCWSKGGRKCGEIMGLGVEGCVLCYEKVCCQERMQAGFGGLIHRTWGTEGQAKWGY